MEAANIVVTSIRITGWGMLVMAKISTTRRGNGGRMVLINIRIRTTVVLNGDSVSTFVDSYQGSVVNIVTMTTAVQLTFPEKETEMTSYSVLRLRSFINMLMPSLGFYTTIKTFQMRYYTMFYLKGHQNYQKLK